MEGRGQARCTYHGRVAASGRPGVLLYQCCQKRCSSAVRLMGRATCPAADAGGRSGKGGVNASTLAPQGRPPIDKRRPGRLCSHAMKRGAVLPPVQNGRMKAAPLVRADLVARTEERRTQESLDREGHRRAEFGQFFTPAPIASLLAGMLEPVSGQIRLLDPGAGVGSLTAAVVDRAERERWRISLDLTAVELDEDLVPSLKETLHECQGAPATGQVDLQVADFIGWACDQLGVGLFVNEPIGFDLAILNPPYRKLRTGSRERQLLSSVGIEATNLYAAFVALALKLLSPGGQLVAITPRSFCNGPYFKAFRREMLSSAALRRIHVFESRDEAFRDTKVLQENVIIHLVNDAEQGAVVIASSNGSGDEHASERSVAFSSVVHPNDADAFIHVVAQESGDDVADKVGSLGSDLEGTGASVSTGRVVDFRAREHLRSDPAPGMVPLLYPLHLRNGRVRWPATSGKKPNALVVAPATSRFLLPAGNYVLVKRFSSKEERRRVVASVLEAEDLDSDAVAIENHINVFHHARAGIPVDVAWGLATYLNSTLVDAFFRQFNGHTQVNATDLRSLRYPSLSQLKALGSVARDGAYEQTAIDALVERHVPETART